MSISHETTTNYTEKTSTLSYLIGGEPLVAFNFSSNNISVGEREEVIVSKIEFSDSIKSLLEWDSVIRANNFAPSSNLYNDDTFKMEIERKLNDSAVSIEAKFVYQGFTLTDLEYENGEVTLKARNSTIIPYYWGWVVWLRFYQILQNQVTYSGNG
jgi:hypothetical protein